MARGADDEPSADAFLAACFPLAAIHGEARVRIEGQPCPMLVEGLRTVHAWWTSWGGMPTPAPEIETAARGRGRIPAGPRRAVAFLSGGVDGLHMLMRNRRLYRKDDPAYIRDALFIHGFDIGKRARDPENERFRMTLRRLDPVAAETGIRHHPVPHQSSPSAVTAGLLGAPPQWGRIGRRRACGDAGSGLPVHWRHLTR